MAAALTLLRTGSVRLLGAGVVASAALVLAPAPSQALTNFTGDYAPGQWNISVSGDASVVANTFTVELFGGDGGSSSFAQFSKTVNQDSLISFDWSYVSADEEPGFEPFFYINGSQFKLSSDGGGQNQSGNLFNIPVAGGSTFGFRQESDGSFGGTTTTISAFNVIPSEVPAPLPLLGAVAAFGWSRRLRKRIQLNRSAS